MPEFCGREVKLFFSPELVALAQHPLVQSRGDAVIREILAYHLLGHLNFTDALETEIIAPVACMIGRGQFELPFTPAMLTDARKIAVDEMYHALFTGGLVEEISAAAGVRPFAKHRPSFLLELDSIKAELSTSLTSLVDFFFATVSETLITATLTRVPNDERVASGVRTILRDHAEDEARHHLYFSDALMMTWPALTPGLRRHIGPLLPRFITMFLTPDLLHAQHCLARIALSATEAESVIEEVYSPVLVQADIRARSETVIRIMQRAGVLEDPQAEDAFRSVGLID
ncbi:diiron oxygenase [Bradyrhizobium sp. CB1015]|uniref:diiron oxygenase n=1 Tax=Bradyrhizobium sp. CB1015 TaxID=2976822 RepID=UPI0039069501